jgi:hypothetical protein
MCAVPAFLAFKHITHALCFVACIMLQNFGKALENYFIPGLIVLGLVCGGIAAKTYNEGATTFVKT